MGFFLWLLRYLKDLEIGSFTNCSHITDRTYLQRWFSKGIPPSVLQVGYILIAHYQIGVHVTSEHQRTSGWLGWLYNCTTPKISIRQKHQAYSDLRLFLIQTIGKSSKYLHFQLQFYFSFILHCCGSARHPTSWVSGRFISSP